MRHLCGYTSLITHHSHSLCNSVFPLFFPSLIRFPSLHPTQEVNTSCVMTAVLVFEFVLSMCVLFGQSFFSKIEFDLNDSVTESPTFLF